MAIFLRKFSKPCTSTQFFVKLHPICARFCGVGGLIGHSRVGRSGRANPSLAALPGDADAR
ncbi:hypothetical protein CBM2626_A260016 [Cupriavidus taiwanensis]|uniref:Uncharacterized protein n=1 Tax=Cupriavidus taiwanensis TaxID=164546 RepID=A0A375E2E0_9BURK|nr:hypothetical protein CBM2604_A170017 [Cupriavidus taiwanensis]SOZ45198.1 hypothetical protein CBM2610_A180017 [Cupriavidus taiwanensis]SOZ58206.1 hypothetical protein CBM2615_A350017 [Cupriavidus taiwanensis]SOZ58868.1 hypothetical protein CBM2614_A310016 [Cupriavidus taiwanensis]SOZ62484.1 hypothetical protein CBM2613_A310017 [Cupriavidus taiwanensis]